MLQRIVTWLRFFPLLGVTACALLGCSDGPKDTGTGTAVVQAMDAAFQDLSSLKMTITAIDLIDTAGGVAKLFPPASDPGATLTLDLVSLASVQPIVAVAQVPANPYAAARIAFQDLTATDQSGGSQTVTTSSNSLQVNFAEPVIVPRDGVARLLLDFDGNASVTSTGPSSLNFSPVIFEVSQQSRASVSGASGRVVSAGSEGFTLALNVGPAGNTQQAASSAQTVELGQLTVITDSNARFVIDGTLFAGNDGLERVRPNDQVDVSGHLVNEAIRAQLVTVNRAGALNPVTLQGTTVLTGPAPGTAALILNRLVRDANGQVTAQPGQGVSVATGAGTAFLPRTVTESFGFQDLFPGQTVEVIGSMAGSTLNASTVRLIETNLAGTLSTVDFPQASLNLQEINGVPVTQFPPVTTPALNLGSAENFIDGFVPTTPLTFVPGQNVTASGIFTAADQFSGSVLSLNQSGEFVASGPFQTSTTGRSFSGTVNGSPVNVFLSPSTHLFQTQAGQTGSLSNSTASDFLGDLTNTTGTVSFRGFQTGSEVQASRAGLQAP